MATNPGRTTATPTSPQSRATPPPQPDADTFLGERYRRIARHRGSKPAIVAVGHSILVLTWHLLSDADARYFDRVTTPSASTPNDASATTYARSKHSAPPSPSNAPPEHRHNPVRLRSAPPDAAARPQTHDFRISW
jgi:hypothetical protein